MKKIIVSILIIVITFTATSYIQYSKKIDKRFIGSWSGSEKDNQVKGVEKKWVQHRFKDGTFVLLFITIEDCEIDSFTEKGKWWIKDGLFYELHNNSNKTDIYSFEFLDENTVKFKAKSLGLDHENNNYEFIDTKITDD